MFTRKTGLFFLGVVVLVVLGAVSYARLFVKADQVVVTGDVTFNAGTAYFGLKPISAAGGPTWPTNTEQYQPSKTLDNNPNTYWAGDPNYTSWSLVYDFGTIQYVNDLAVHYYSRALRGIVFTPQTITAQASVDGDIYTNVASSTDKNNDSLRLDVKTSARYIKLVFDGKSDAPSSRQAAVQDVTFTGSLPLHPTTASGGPTWPTNTEQYQPSKTLDNNPNTYWAGDPQYSSWSLVYDFGASKYVNDLTLRYYPRTLRSPTFVPQNVTIFKSDDGVGYVQVTKTVNKADDVQSLILAVNARYIKLELNGKSDAPSNRQPAIRDISFTGTDQTVLAPNDGITYTSSFDSSKLKARVTYQQDGRAKPLVILMHGWAGVIDNVQEAANWSRDHGLFAVSVAMRGRDGSEGVGDNGRVEIHDIYDAVQYALRQYPGEIDRGRVAIWGFSGGGGNAFSAATKLPDTFNQVATFFGISDYAAWYANGAGDRAPTIATIYGGTPDQVPVRYLASRSLDGVGNNPWSDINLFWDERESICPPYLDENWLAEASRLGYSNSTAHRSLTADAHRWLHGYPQQGDSLEWAMGNVLLPRLVESAPNAITIPDQGAPKFHILGFLVTKKFNVYLGTADRTVADLTYTATDKVMNFTFENAVAEVADTKATLVIPLNGRTYLDVVGGQGSIKGNELTINEIPLNGSVTVRFE